MLRLKQYPSRSPYWYVRGTVAGTRVDESTGTTNEKLAQLFLERREMVLYENRHLTYRSWAHIPEPIIDELRKVFYSSLKNARVRKQDNQLSFAFVKSLYIRQRGRCALSGIPFKIERPEGKSSHHRPFAPSIDRIDNSKSYVVGNVRLVCRIANMAMNIWGEEALRDLALGVADMWARGCEIDAQSEDDQIGQESANG